MLLAQAARLHVARRGALRARASAVAPLRRALGSGASRKIGAGAGVGDSAQGDASVEVKVAALTKERDQFFGRWNWLLKLLGYYGNESTDIRSGQALFRSSEQQSTLAVKDPAFGLSFDFFDSKNFMQHQQLLMLHVWMIHRRLLKESESGKALQEVLFDTLWEDTTRRIRATGVHELTVNKHLATVQKSCFTSAVSYDHGLTITNDENLELGSAIWRNVYSSDPKTPDESVYRMAEYVRNQIASLEAQTNAELFEGRVSWLDVNVAAKAAEAQQSDWRQAVAPNGRAYYYHVKTRETRWTKPPGA
jgi:cytochrome b pre-mRNA-processing protein 3